MRPIQLSVVAFGVLVPLSALAGGQGGGSSGGGGGALSHVSSGLGGASGGASGGSATTIVRTDPDNTRYVRLREQEVPSATTTVIVRRRPVAPEPPSPAAHFEGYAGAQKVHDSDGSFTAELALVDDRLRVGGTFSRYYEAQPGMDALTLTIPSLTLGVRINDDLAGSKIYLVGGLVGAKTANDKVMDSSFVGAIGGIRIETPLSRSLGLVGEAQLMQFRDNVRATSVRAGIKVGPMQASLRMLDFNVGPPLWGPELGVGF
jgi:hypothetical protein